MTARSRGMGLVVHYTGYCVAISVLIFWRAWLPVIPCLPPHKFVEVGRELVAITTLHSLQFCLHPVPVALYCLGVDTGSRVYKMKRMIDHPMSSHTRGSGDRVVCPPLIRVDGGPWCCVCLDYWQEGVCVS